MYWERDRTERAAKKKQAVMPVFFCNAMILLMRGAFVIFKRFYMLSRVKSHKVVAPYDLLTK